MIKVREKNCKKWVKRNEMQKMVDCVQNLDEELLLTSASKIDIRIQQIFWRRVESSIR